MINFAELNKEPEKKEYIEITGHRWLKKKEQKPWNNTKQILPWIEDKEVFCFSHLCPVHDVKVKFLLSNFN